MFMDLIHMLVLVSRQKFWNLAEVNKNFHPHNNTHFIVYQIVELKPGVPRQGNSLFEVLPIMYFLTTIYQVNSIKWYNCNVFREDWSTKREIFDKKLHVCNIWYPGFDMFMLTSVDATNDTCTSNNKYMRRHNVGALKEYFYHLKQQVFHNCEVITSLQCTEFWKVSHNYKNVSYSASAVKFLYKWSFYTSSRANSNCIVTAVGNELFEG